VLPAGALTVTCTPRPRLPRSYGAVLLIDTEDEFSPAEVAALHAGVRDGLSVLVFADWYVLLENLSPPPHMLGSLWPFVYA
jgi:hypothetical protein